MTLAVQILTGLLRLGLSGLSTWLISNGIISADQNTELIAGIALGVVTVVWSIVSKYNVMGWILTALAHPKGTTFDDLTEAIKTSGKVPTSTPTDMTPQLPSTLLVILFAISLAGAAFTLPACAHTPPSVTTPAGTSAVTADIVVKRLGELQAAAIAANQQGALSDKTAVLVVQFTVGAIKTASATPAGWQTTVATAYQALKSALPPADAQRLAVAFATVDALLANFGG